MSKEIILRNRHGVAVGRALVDVADYEELVLFKWHMKVKEGGRCYARRCWKDGDKRHALMMHAAVLGSPPDGMLIDHINRDSLDNRRGNLRFVTHSGNVQNRGLIRCNTSGARGVSFDAQTGKWRAVVKLNRQKVFSRYFSTVEEATLAAKAKRLELLQYATD